MIFVSSSCLKNDCIKDSVKELAEAGFSCIELSGGSRLYDGFIEDLLELKAKYNLTYRCHNYFPPPAKPFVLNLASLNDEMFELSYSHVRQALHLSEQLGADKYGFHAGFLISIDLDEIGKPIKEKPLFDRQKASKRFIQSAQELSEISKVKLYIENNVLSEANYNNYKKNNPLLMTTSSEILSFLEITKLPLLLDVAHLKVTTQTLGLNFVNEFSKLIPFSDYIHLSDNDGTKDSNNAFERKSELFEYLKGCNLAGKDFTIEVYSGIKDVMSSYVAIKDLAHG